MATDLGKEVYALVEENLKRTMVNKKRRR